MNTIHSITRFFPSLAIAACVFYPAHPLFAQRPIPPLSDADVAHLRASIPAQATAKPTAPRRVLVYNFTYGIYHDEAIAWATRALELMGETTGAFTTTATSDPSVFTPENLSNYDAVVMNNTMLSVFGPPETEEVRMQALVDFVHAGKGIVGIHSASVWEKDAASAADTEFRQLIGGRFRNHPWEFEALDIRVEDPAHPLNAAWAGKTALPLPWRDELFQFDQGYAREKVRVLFSLDLSKTADKGQRPDKDYALAWIQSVEKGRSFYTALGHDKNAFRDPAFLRHLQDGVQFALGDLPADTTPVPQPKVDLEEGFVSIFNGKDLSGWRGDQSIWRIEDGTIIGQSLDATQVKANSFLIWEGGQPADFELKCRFKLEGGNSGIYFHAYEPKTDDASANGEPLVGPQADFSADNVWTGVVMEYRRREKLVDRGRKILITETGERKDAGSVGDPEELLKAYRDNDWNDYHVIVRGNLVLLRINDVVMSELRDNDPNRLKSGLLAFQVHTGPPMKVQFKDIRLRQW